MIKHFDHVTIVVSDVDETKRFFGLLGLEQTLSVVISGEIIERYMGIPGLDAEHVTLALPDASPRMEVQLLKYRHPDSTSDPKITDLTRLGFNHVCFAVDDMEAAIGKLKAGGVEILNDVMDFHDRKLVFMRGPEGITLELSEWY